MYCLESKEKKIFFIIGDEIPKSREFSGYKYAFGYLFNCDYNKVSVYNFASEKSLIDYLKANEQYKDFKFYFGSDF